MREDARDAFLSAAKLDAVAKGGSKKKRKPGDPKPAEPALTTAEAAAIRAAIADLDGSAYVDALYDDSSALVHAAYKDAAAVLDVSASFDTPPAWALDKVKDAADHVGSLIDERDRAALTNVLDDALAQGLSSRDAAANLKAAFDVIRAVADDGAVRETRSDAWFSMVARTELQTAAVQGQLSLYEAAGIKKLRWQAAEPCDICAQYDDQVFDIDDLPDDEPGSVHPYCCCIWSPADDDLGDWRGSDSDRASAARGNSPDDEE